MSLIEFLNARLVEDWEATAQMVGVGRYRDEDFGLADIDAKRRILDECAYWYDKVNASKDYPALADRFEVAMSVLRLLALPYTLHPDYVEAWKP